MSSITKPKHPCGVFTQTQTHHVGAKPEPDAPSGGGRGGGWRGAVMVVWVAVMRWRGWSRGGGGDDDDNKMMMMMMVSIVWKDDRRSDKSYSREKSGKFGKSTSVIYYSVKFDGNYPRWFFKEDVSTVWKDDRRSDKSYSREKSGKFRKSTTVKFDGNYPRWFFKED
ncbi:hypothetical protein Tco_0228370 [Tanacetum coccineum]